MAGVLGLGSSGSLSLNDDLLKKLRAADEKALIDPLDLKLEKITKEREVINGIQEKVNDLFKAAKLLSLNQTDSVNVFQEKTLDSVGDGVSYAIDNAQNIKDGSIHVKVDKVAKKDVWQTNQFSSQDDKVNQGKLTINGVEIDTTDKTYKEVTEEINKISGVNASIVENADGKFRISIKSSETGKDNAISFEGSDSGALSHFGLDQSSNHVQEAQDMKMTIDGVEYSGSSNTVVVNGIKVTAVKEGEESTLTIQPDTTNIKKVLNNFIQAYNTLNELIDKELTNTKTTLEDKASIRAIRDNLKQALFGTGHTGTTDKDGKVSGEKTIFNYGISFDAKSGNLVLNTTEFDKALKEDPKGLENLFVGSAEKKGVGTMFDELISTDGINMSILDYESNMLSREKKITEEKEKEEKKLDIKYNEMSLKFAAYTVMITNMENSFSGLKLMISQSASK